MEMLWLHVCYQTGKALSDGTGFICLLIVKIDYYTQRNSEQSWSIWKHIFHWANSFAFVIRSRIPRVSIWTDFLSSTRYPLLLLETSDGQKITAFYPPCRSCDNRLQSVHVLEADRNARSSLLARPSMGSSPSGTEFSSGWVWVSLFPHPLPCWGNLGSKLICNLSTLCLWCLCRKH